MVATSLVPSTVKETITWLLQLGRPPLPECPIEAAKQGKEPKAPCYFDGRRVIPISWKQWQDTQPIADILKTWFSHPKTGIGTLGGWNGKHWLGWIDFDAKNFPTRTLCDRTIEAWEKQYPVLASAPMFRTPSGGYRFLVGFDSEPENFKANSGFSLNPDGLNHVGELLSKNGGHTLLPPTVGITGTPYQWVRWSEYPPVVSQPEDIGLHPLEKAKSKQKENNRTDLISDSNQLSELLEREIYPRLSADRLFSWHGHDFKLERSGKLKGSCPWHESKSGTAFYAEQVQGIWLWRCPACDIGGGPIEYRHRLAGGDGWPKGKEFVELVSQLANEVGVTMPQWTPAKAHNDSPTPKVVPLRPPVDTISDDDLLVSINGLIEEDLEESTLQLRLTNLSLQSGQPLKQIEQLFKSRAREIEQKQWLKDEFPGFELLINYRLKNQINWEECLPQRLIKALSTKSEADRIDIMYLIQNLFPAIGSLMGAKIGLVGKVGETERAHWIEYPNVWTATIAPPSSGKSNADRAILTPIRRMQDSEQERYESDKQELNRVLEAWSRLNKHERAELIGTLDDPDVFKQQEVGTCKKYLFNYGEIEAISRRISEQPIGAGMLWNSDELLGLFNGLDQYKSGNKGNGRQFLLNAWTGPLSGYVDRVNENESFIFRGQLLTICGGMQVKPAASFFNPDGDNSDADGLQSRILPALPELHPDFDEWNETKVSLDGVLTDLYERVQRLPVGLVYLDVKAKSLWIKEWSRYRRGYKTYVQKNPAFAYFLGKMCSNLLRLALIIHAVEHCYSSKFDFFTLDAETFSRAIAVANFYIGQFRLAQVQFTQSPEQGLSEFMMNILTLCLHERELAPYQVVNRWRRQRSKNGKPIKSSDVKEMFAAIAEARPQMVKFDGKKLIALDDSSLQNFNQKRDRISKNTIATRSPDRYPEALQNGHSSTKHDQTRSGLIVNLAKNEGFHDQKHDRMIVFSPETLAIPSLENTIGRSCPDRVLGNAIVFSDGGEEASPEVIDTPQEAQPLEISAEQADLPQKNGHAVEHEKRDRVLPEHDRVFEKAIVFLDGTPGEDVEVWQVNDRVQIKSLPKRYSPERIGAIGEVVQLTLAGLQIRLPGERLPLVLEPENLIRLNPVQETELQKGDRCYSSRSGKIGIVTRCNTRYTYIHWDKDKAMGLPEVQYTVSDIEIMEITKEVPDCP